MEMSDKYNPNWTREEKEAWAKGVTDAMVDEQEQRKNDSAEVMDGLRAEEGDVGGEGGEGKIRVRLEVDPQDLRPSPYSRPAEDALSPEETEGEQRQDYDLIKDK